MPKSKQTWKRNPYWRALIMSSLTYFDLIPVFRVITGVLLYFFQSIGYNVFTFFDPASLSCQSLRCRPASSGLEACYHQVWLFFMLKVSSMSPVCSAPSGTSNVLVHGSVHWRSALPVCAKFCSVVKERGLSGLSETVLLGGSLVENWIRGMNTCAQGNIFRDIPTVQPTVETVFWLFQSGSLSGS